MIRRFPSLLSIVSGVVVVAVGLSGAGAAQAQSRPGARAGADEITTLEKNLASEHAALSTADCSTACRALASIRRAADRICALDPDERCLAARAKADDATRRVREACPECAIAFAPITPGPEQPTAKPGPYSPSPTPAAKGGTPRSDQESTQVAPANAPPSESRRGGCAGCTTSGASPGDVGTLGLALAALAVVMRRRRARRTRA